MCSGLCAACAPSYLNRRRTGRSQRVTLSPWTQRHGQVRVAPVPAVQLAHCSLIAEAGALIGAAVHAARPRRKGVGLTERWKQLFPVQLEAKPLCPQDAAAVGADTLAGVPEACTYSADDLVVEVIKGIDAAPAGWTREYARIEKSAAHPGPGHGYDVAGRQVED